MCGICGVIGLESTDEAAAILGRMMNAMVHRGPDAEGSLAAPGAALGMRRLSIIDIAGGNQPVWNEDGTLAVVFNGEIYNFGELREELAALGHRFASRSDTEVIVHAYEAWGEECVRRFHGMFAFAVAEMPRGAGGPVESVFIARDTLGIKPLYYALSNGALLFASEVRSLLASGCIAARLSPDSLAAYLLFGSVSEPASLVDGVFSLPPGHSMRISATRPATLPCTKSFGFGGGLFRSIAGKNGPRVAQANAVPEKRVRTLLDEAVRKHLVADVPVGVFLSSGLDSTALAALASRVQKGIHTFTVAFPDLAFSEAEIARRTAERLGTQHQELTLSSDEMLARLDEAICGFDQPSMDGINTYFVSWAARQAGLKVALSGLGSDELFGGYSTFRDTHTLQKVAGAARLFPKSLRDVAARVAGGRKLAGSPDATQKALAAWRDSALLPDEYFFTRLLFTPEKIAEATHTDATAWHSTLWWKWLSGAVRQSQEADDFTKVSWLELRSYMANTLLRDTDAMSMHHSLEVRVPFLDLPLVEYVLSLSAEEKGLNKRPKWLLVEALGDVLPDETLAQRKRTFTFPWDNWLRGALQKRVSEGLADWSLVLAAHVDRDFAVRIWKDFQAGRTSWSRPWSLFVLNEWVKRHLPASAPHNTIRQNADTARVA